MFVTWYKDGKQVYASYRCITKVIGNTCVLEYHHECDDDTPGKYSCEVTHEDGSDICHALVTLATGQLTAEPQSAYLIEFAFSYSLQYLFNIFSISFLIFPKYFF